MIEISSAMQQDAIKELLDGKELDGVTFNFEKKQGIKLLFNVSTDDADAAAKIAKEAIKEEAWGKVLYFQAIGK
ncbi:hypothetical protein ACODG4_02865 [Vagococcus fluvialis]|jgi:hypothetical protein|uniref:Uncharacterized protein n=1 Tax=Vagococcus fluvialis TaxID=2738 RepID=A0A369AX58_9ENTE|nr:hypothetical protein [Vagococcus fluvialis]MDR2278563.1 hypothetical protein [Vagococcus sp.]OTP34038.1 hypothetical protein A5798_000771 [Enterococcus sp. 6C8_DIV0013]MBO0419544.1 hypothetical protein [Vagococcus fluvialis]MBO0429768.1 hypothetical protein [Vagococcus fluvialis]NKC59791.1 hypothetical protein [Vagococcus fluvialis]